MKRRSLSSSRAGFTLLEIMLVVAIIVLLLGAAIYKMMPQLGTAKIARAQADIATIGIAIMGYESLGGRPPSSEQGLNALVERPNSEPRPRQWSKGMDSVPLDPWGNPYIYKQPGTHKTTSNYDLFSAGPDRQPGTQDDVGNWDDSASK
jgi:general secretion pathway protein G